MINIDRWTVQSPDGLSTDFYRDLALKHTAFAGLEGLKLAKLIRKGEFASLIAYEIDYSLPLTPMEFYHLRQVLAFFSKLDYLDIGIDKEEAALSTFLESEALCRETNQCFQSWSSGEFKFLPHVDRVLSDAARLIAQVLGPVPSLNKLGLRFGPGATALTKKRDASARRKLSDGLACSEDLLPVLSKVLLEIPAWTKSFSTYHYVDGGPLVLSGDCSVLLPDYVPFIVVGIDAPHGKVDVHSREELFVTICDETLSFALKNAKTKRAVATPPPLNSMVQLGFGDYMARRLLRFGIDLRDQSLNQRLAKEGSLTGALATLDLSSASDTIAYWLVWHLLPVDWATALSQCRCSTVTYRGETRTMEKFSSMGNGYTFPLESLIFWALATVSSSDKDVVSVYGDDIIMQKENVPLFKEVLVACGFKLNLRKSFDSGPFRESCGSDWYRGFNIRPWYAKKACSVEVLYQLHNYYVRTGQQEFSESVLMLIPEDLRLFGPDGLGDGILLGTWVPGKRKPRQDRAGYSGSLVKMHKHTGLREKAQASPFDQCHALYASYRRAVSAHSKTGLVDLGLTKLGKNFRHHQFLVGTGVPSLDIPFSKEEGNSSVKAVSLPGTDGSHRVLVYTL